MNPKRLTSAVFAFATTLVLFASPAFAQGAEAAAGADSWKGLLALAIGLGLGMSGVGLLLHGGTGFTFSMGF